MSKDIQQTIICPLNANTQQSSCKIKNVQRKLVFIMNFIHTRLTLNPQDQISDIRLNVPQLASGIMPVRYLSTFFGISGRVNLN